MAAVGSLDEFPLRYRVLLRTYRWRKVNPVPWAPLPRPLSECRLAIVSSAGFVLPDQEGFDTNRRGGDCSFREIPSDADVTTMRECHRSDAFDHEPMRRDANIAFPLDRARELVERGRIGSIAPRHLSFMGSITAPGRLVKESAPRAANLLVRDEVDLALLVPV